MAHNLDMSNNQANMAYVGQTPWHGLGATLPENASLEDWTAAAGFNWEALSSRVAFYPDAKMEKDVAVLGEPATVPNQMCIFRSDTKTPLSIMSEGYKLVQPKAVMEFFRDVAEAGKLKMETAGMLKGGALYWAMARIDDQYNVTKDDPILPYVLMATSLDGSLATTIGFNSVRVVCNNTLQAAVNQKTSNNTQIKVPHNSLFDEVRVKKELGMVGDQWNNFKLASKKLADRKVSREELIEFMVSVFVPEKKRETFSLLETDDILSKMPNIQKCINLYQNGVGQNTKSAKDTAWGLVNTITRMVDHETKAISADSRLRSAWFGEGKRRKERALSLALKLTEE